jgi:hypothetical protein
MTGFQLNIKIFKNEIKQGELLKIYTFVRNLKEGQKEVRDQSWSKLFNFFIFLVYKFIFFLKNISYIRNGKCILN